MDNGREVVVLSGVRTAIGDYGGGLKDIAPTDLAARVVREAVSRAKVAPEEVGHVVFGHVIHTEPKDMYLSRVATINAGLPKETPALTLNRLCGSGLQAIVSAAQTIKLGDADVAVGGGAESMSRGIYASAHRTLGRAHGRRADHGHDGRGADRSLRYRAHGDHGGERRGQMGHQPRHAGRAGGGEQPPRGERHRQRLLQRADSAGRVEEQERAGRCSTPTSIRAQTRAWTAWRSCAPCSRRTARSPPGNASGINDGAAAVVLMERKAAERKGLKPMARLVAYAHAGVDPKYMGIGPVPAVKKVLERAGLKIGDMDVIESNEAFAAQACAVAKDLDFDMKRVNPNGGAIALGHPIGATGCILTIKAAYELQRTGGRYGLVTMCIGGGQGIAAVFERL